MSSRSRRLARLERQDAGKKMPAEAVLAAIASKQWAITPEGLHQIVTIATRQNVDPQMIEMLRGEELRNTYSVEVRDGIATIPVHGPMFRYANLFSRISGATSYQDLATDFKTTLDDPRVRAIILDMDTPGGEVNGCLELARNIHAARGTKPIIAYVSNWACSGGYELAAACDEIVIFEAAMLGSIGCIATYVDATKAMEEAGYKEIVIVSSQSPHKDIDPAAAEGRSQIQVVLDDLAAVFIGDVARFRGITPDTVLADFGQGGVFIGQKAIDQGMADRISDYESLHAELLARDTTPSGVFAVKARAIAPATTPTVTGEPVKTTAPAAAPSAQATPPAAAATTGSEGSETGADDEEKKDETKKEQQANAEADDATDDEEKEPKPGEPGYDAHVRTLAAAAERKRIADIRALAKPGEEVTVQACIDDASCTVEQAALRLREAEGKTGQDRLAALRNDDAGAHAPNAIAPATDATPASAAKSSVAAFYSLKDPKSPNRSSR